MDNTRVAILIQTMNRPDFVIRTLSYYAKMRSPHPIYLADSSDPDKAEKIKSAIKRLSQKIEIHYNWYPPGFETWGESLSLVKEKYTVANGDDDYSVPSSLTKCAEFLEKNPDYIAAGGHGITFRLKTSGPYGEIKRLTDYPNHSLEAETASQRLIDFLKKCYVITYSVNRVDHMKKMMTMPLPIITTWSELFQNSYCAISGKVKLIDCIGAVRQIHDKQYHSSLMIDWLTEKGFHDYYNKYRDYLSAKIIESDKISQQEANDVVKKAFWEYLQVYMANEQKGLRATTKPEANLVSASLRTKVATTFPVLKNLYRKYLRSSTLQKQFHYEVINPRSPYYNDFQMLIDSFTGRDK